ncbi:hypothetical protein PL8927_480011 [Planktothrix serta PCC 8927]|uniref:Uncharacterized protein n=1 Tax=Planktothrix serta PCC 8927 TaxID=671068 RepID=A0A7Z9BJH5_9CYAN|nr:hypothetical protein PL8927_480011 [Planktothrix serta PCC 8927]
MALIPMNVQINPEVNFSTPNGQKTKPLTLRSEAFTPHSPEGLTTW